MTEEFAAIDWEGEFSHKSVQEMHGIFCSHYEEICNTHIPKIRISGKKKKKIMGLSANEATIIRKKHRAWVRYIETKNH